MFKAQDLLNAASGKLISGLKDTAIKGISIDSRTIKREEAFVAIKGNNFDGHDFIDQAIKKGATCVIKKSPSHQVTKSPEIAVIEVEDTTKALGDIARFHRQKFNLPVIAVTGSNGKTTTKEMVAQVLSRRFKVLKNEGTKNNQIGVPLTLLKLDADDEMLVLELGSSHFGEIARLASVCQPNIGIITNIGPSHLEFLHDLKGAFKEKYTLIANLKPPYLAILNADDNLLKRKISSKNSKPAIFSFGVKHRSDFFAALTKHSGEKLEFLVNSKYKFVLRTLGDYNIYNALPAVAVARLLGMEYRDIALGLSKFEFPAGRLKLIKFKQVRFIDDTYNSNPLSLRQALNTLGNFKAKGRKILVMGDMLELGKSQGAFHADAACHIARVCHTFISVGQLSQIAASAARNCGFNPQNIFTCASSLGARDILFQQVVPREDDIVLVKGSRAMRMEEVFK